MSDTTRQVGADLSSGTGAAPYKRELHVERTKATATYTREGERAALEASAPVIGTVMETISGVSFYITSYNISELETSSAARITVSAEAVYAETTGTLPPLGPASYDVEFSELHLAIEQHPCMGSLTSYAIENHKSLENWQDLRQPGGPSNDWELASTPPTFWAGIEPWTLDQYKSIKGAGIADFVMYLPVVTRTLTYLGRPSGLGSSSGTKQSPPTGAYDFISLYQWLLGPDACVQRGDKYERKTSWTASTRINPLIYPNWD